MAKGRGNSGFKGALISAFMLILIAGALLGWARANNINSVADVISYAKAWSDKFDQKVHECIDSQGNFVDCSSDVAVGPAPGGGNAGGGGENSGGDSTGEGGSGDISAPEGSVSPVDALRATLSEIPVKEPVSVDYDRKEWKHWTGSPCNTREEVLIRDGENVSTGDRCKITGGKWISPYDNVEFTDASKLDIDHVIPLGYAAKNGGNGWTPAIKEQFANDMDQLLAVSAKENRSKSDKGPGEYMPPLEAYHCEYATIWIETADTYGLSISTKDRNALDKALNTCEK